MTRSGKRADVAWQDDQEQGEERIAVENLDHLGLEIPDPGRDFDSSSNSRLGRISKSGLEGIKEQIQKQRKNKMQNFWRWDKMREYKALQHKRGRLARLGGGHMLRSGKRSLG